MNKYARMLVFLADDLLDKLTPEEREDYLPRYIESSYHMQTLGCWIPCDADNPPPADTPMLLWCPSYLSGGVRYPASPVWADETCYNVGEPGIDYTHYMLIGEPS